MSDFLDFHQPFHQDSAHDQDATLESPGVIFSPVLDASGNPLLGPVRAHSSILSLDEWPNDLCDPRNVAGLHQYYPANHRPTTSELEVEFVSKSDPRQVRPGSCSSSEYIKGLPGNASLDERLEYVLASAQQAGFETLDMLLSKYYTADLRNSPAISNAQRLSRKRHLPQVLANLRKSSANWTDWELSGYKDEILQSAETILLEETGKYMAMNSSQFGNNDKFDTRGITSATQSNRTGYPIVTDDMEGTSIEMIRNKFQQQVRCNFVHRSRH